MSTDSKFYNLTNDKFSLFMDVITTIAKTCDDLDIKDGMIRQKTTIQSSIVQADLTAIGLDELDAPISRIQQKAKMLSILCKQDSELEIELNDNDIIFRDQLSSISTSKALDKFLTNTYISEEDLIRMLDLKEDGLLLSCRLDSNMLKRLFTMSDALSADSFTLEFKGNQSSIVVKNSAMKSSVTAELMKIEDDSLPDNLYCAYKLEAFNIDTEYLDLEFWYNSDENNMILKIQTELKNDDITVPITVYSVSRIDTLV